MTLVTGKVTGQRIDVAHKCPECEHWWNDHVGPVINWTRRCDYLHEEDKLLGLPCKCTVDLHKYPQALWDRVPGWNEPVLVASGEHARPYAMSLACQDKGCFSTPPCANICALAAEHDPVNHPSHYTSHPSGVECIQITEHYNFCLGNAIKYIWRAGLKDATDSIQDLEKARWYLDREITRLKSVAAHVVTDTASS